MTAQYYFRNKDGFEFYINVIIGKLYSTFLECELLCNCNAVTLKSNDRYEHWLAKVNQKLTEGAKDLSLDKIVFRINICEILPSRSTAPFSLFDSIFF